MWPALLERAIVFCPILLSVQFPHFGWIGNGALGLGKESAINNNGFAVASMGRHKRLAAGGGNPGLVAGLQDRRACTLRASNYLPWKVPPPDQKWPSDDVARKRGNVEGLSQDDPGETPTDFLIGVLFLEGGLVVPQV